MTEQEYKITKEREINAILYSLGDLNQFFKIDNLTDIWVDEHGLVSIKKFGQQRESTDVHLSTQQVKNIILQIAKLMEINIDYQHYPVLEGTIPLFNARITGVIGNWSSAPTITIRKPPKKIFTIDEYIDQGALTKEKAELIKNCIRNKKNILISGGTNSGKTTFANACLDEMAKSYPRESLLIIEDNAELQCKADYAQFLRINVDDANNAIRAAMRLSPNHIVFGEIRSGTVLWALLDGWNTGHPGGLSTIHASSAEGTFLRMKMLLAQVFTVVPPLNRMIDLIVHMASREGGVICDEVISPKDYSESEIEELAKHSIEQDI